MKSRKTRTLYNEKGKAIGIVDEDRNLYTLAGNISYEMQVPTDGFSRTQKVAWERKNASHKARLEALNANRFTPFEKEDEEAKEASV